MKKEYTSTINNKISKIIHKVFVKYDLLGVIEKGFPEDEYQMEESKLYFYIENNINLTKQGIYDELVKIIEEWFGKKTLNNELLNILDKMSEEIFSNLKEK